MVANYNCIRPLCYFVQTFVFLCGKKINHKGTQSAH